jgi:hypothetical protein
VTDDGRPLVTRVHVTDAAGTRQVHSATGELGRYATLETADFELPPHAARDLKVWIHAVDGNGGTTSLPATVRLGVDGATTTDHRMRGELRLASLHPASRVEVRLAEAQGVAT